MNMKSGRLVAILVGACLLLGACSPSSPPAAPAAQSGTGIGPCGGIGPAQAAAILHVAPADVTGPQHLSTFTCIYRSRKDFYTSMTFNVYVEPSAMQAARKLAALRDGLANLSPIQAVDHLGDEAWRAPDPRVKRLLMRKGNVWLDVVTPGDEASQVQMARIVLAHLH